MRVSRNFDKQVRDKNLNIDIAARLNVVAKVNTGEDNATAASRAQQRTPINQGRSRRERRGATPVSGGDRGTDG
jgi:hypothetical protein